jgi:hypothetical protein
MKKVILTCVAMLVCSSAHAGGLGDLLASYQGSPQTASSPFRTVALRRQVTAVAPAPVAAPFAVPAALQFDTGAALRSTNRQCSDGGCDR